MHLTLVSPYDPFPDPQRDGGAHLGGVERVFAEVSKRLAARGHDVEVVCSSEDPRPSPAPHERIHVTRVRRQATVMRTPVAPLAESVPADTDIVQVAATYPFTTPNVLRRARRAGVPALLDFHFEPDPVSLLGRAAARLYRVVGPAAYPLAQAVLVRSLAYGRNAPSLDRVPEARWRVVPNGVDTDRFRPDGPRIGDGNLLFVGRLVPYKGLGGLLHALSRVPDAPPLWVAGDGPLRPELERLAGRLGVDAHFLGRVPDHELPALYRGASLTVLPSVGRQECFGITLVESMACGTPVLASAIPGVEEIARFGGLVAPAGQPVAWAEAIQRAMREPARRGGALAKRVQAAFGWDAVADRLLEVYKEVTDARERNATAREVKHADPRSDPVL